MAALVSGRPAAATPRVAGSRATTPTGRSTRRRQQLVALGFIAPALLLFAVFVVYPIVFNVQASTPLNGSSRRCHTMPTTTGERTAGRKKTAR